SSRTARTVALPASSREMTAGHTGAGGTPGGSGGAAGWFADARAARGAGADAVVTAAGLGATDASVALARTVVGTSVPGTGEMSTCVIVHAPSTRVRSSAYRQRPETVPPPGAGS